MRSNRGWRPAVRFRGAMLLNGWAKARGELELSRCAVCDARITGGDHAVHQGGEIFHPHCLLYPWTGS